jgi:hypothetical protein
VAPGTYWNLAFELLNVELSIVHWSKPGDNMAMVWRHCSMAKLITDRLAKDSFSKIAEYPDCTIKKISYFLAINPTVPSMEINVKMRRIYKIAWLTRLFSPAVIDYCSSVNSNLS